MICTCQNESIVLSQTSWKVWDSGTFYVRWISTLLLLMTTCIYIFVIKLQHVYDKCCRCYLICFLVHLLINRLIEIDKFPLSISCYIVEYLNYYVTISSYLWLTVMSFEFYRAFVAYKFVTNQHNIESRFWKYNLFVWGMATVFLLVTILADHLLDHLDIDSSWGVGYAYYDCIFKSSNWWTFICLPGPAALMTLIKAIFMIASILHVYIENRENRKQLEELGQQNMKNNMMFTIYIRLLTTEILNWLTELSYVLYLTSIKRTKYLQSIVTYFNLIYFILIFALTLTRKDVRQFFSNSSDVSRLSSRQST